MYFGIIRFPCISCHDAQQNCMQLICFLWVGGLNNNNNNSKKKMKKQKKKNVFI